MLTEEEISPRQKYIDCIFDFYDHLCETIELCASEKDYSLSQHIYNNIIPAISELLPYTYKKDIKNDDEWFKVGKLEFKEFDKDEV